MLTTSETEKAQSHSFDRCYDQSLLTNQGNCSLKGPTDHMTLMPKPNRGEIALLTECNGGKMTKNHCALFMRLKFDVRATFRRFMSHSVTNSKLIRLLKSHSLSGFFCFFFVFLALLSRLRSLTFSLQIYK